MSVYGDRFLKVLAACRSVNAHPIMCYSATISIEWQPPVLSGNERAFANANWKLVTMILDVCDESTDAYAHSTEADRALAKPIMAWPLYWAGDRVMQSPGFDWGRLGKNGDKLVEHRNAYTFEEHNHAVSELISVDTWVSSLCKTSWYSTSPVRFILTRAQY